MTESSANQAFSPWLKTLLIVVFTLPIAVYIVNGTFTRPLTDDFCAIMDARQHGYPGILIHQYLNWQPGLSSTSLQTFVALAGIWATQLLPAALILTLWLAFLWLIRETTKLLGWRSEAWAHLLLAAGATLALIDGLPNLPQAVYWTSGASTYLPSVTLLIVYCALLARTIRTEPRIHRAALAAVVLAFLCCGFNPTMNAMFITLCAILMPITWVMCPAPRRHLLLWVLALSLLTAFAVLIFTLTAPGTTARAALQPPMLPMGTIILQTLAGSLAFTATAILLYGPFSLLALLIMAGVFSYVFTPFPIRYVQRYWRLMLLISAIIYIVLVLACTATAVYASADYLPARAFSVPQAALVGLVMVWGFIMGSGLKRSTASFRMRPTLLLLFAAVGLAGPVYETYQQLVYASRLATFASEWDSRDAYLRATEQRDAVVKPFTFDLAAASWIEPIGTNPNRWFNICAARYYGLDSLAVHP
jgi:hypothetical protein